MGTPALEKVFESHIFVNNKEYIGLREFMHCFKYKYNTYSVRNCCNAGMPHIEKDGKYYFNISDCWDWYAGNWKA